MRLELSLQAVGDALARADLERLLTAEPELATALDAVARCSPARSTGTSGLAIDAARSSLLRCRRLGAALLEFTRISLDPTGQSGYSRTGMVPGAGSARERLRPPPSGRRWKRGVRCRDSSEASRWRRARSTRSASGWTSRARTSPTSTRRATRGAVRCLAAVPPYEKLSAGGGVESHRPPRDARRTARAASAAGTSRRAARAGHRRRRSRSSRPRSGSRAQSVDAATQRLLRLGSARLAADPTSAIARAEDAVAGRALASSFKDMADRLDQARRDTDAGVRDGVAQVNELATRIATIEPGARRGGGWRGRRAGAEGRARRGAQVAVGPRRHRHDCHGPTAASTCRSPTAIRS